MFASGDSALLERGGVSDQVGRNTLLWLLVAQGVAIFPLFFFLPLWLPLMWLGVVIARVQMFRGAWPFPRNFVKTLLGAGCIIGLIISYRSVAGVEPMVAFLVVAFILKLVEVRDKHGVVLIVYIGFIAVAALFIFSQSLWAALYSLFTLTILFGCLQSMFCSQVSQPGKQVVEACILLLKSLPVMGILFLVLPRISPLWAVPEAGKSGKTGFSGTVSPGDISRLVRSQEIAFRVDFNPDNSNQAVVPPPEQRYWRGLTLDTYDGRSWRFRSPWQRSGDTLSSVNLPHPRWSLQRQGDATFYEYSIILEAHGQPWLFSLMVPLQVTSELKMGFTDDYLIMTGKDIRQRTLYRVQSSTGYLRSPYLTEAERRVNQTIPRGNPRALALAGSWQQRQLSAQQTVDAALALFNREFVYSLQPPALGTHSVDEFLFDTRTGFCEHFASSFTFLMRAAGIPARLVVGYQGGTFSEDASHMVVRQSDAHAWAEVWLPSRGWVRVDPTNAVAPERIRRGIQDALSLNDAQLLNSGLLSSAWLQTLTLKLEELEYLWQKNVLSYDNQDKDDLLKKLFGSKAWWLTGLLLIGGIGLLLLMYHLLPLPRLAGKRAHPAEVMYRKYLRGMQAQGLQRQPWETATAFARRVLHESPANAKYAMEIADLYNHIIYQGRSELVPALREILQEKNKSRAVVQKLSR
ncbi:MAG: DUF3488 and transglutaminase-like domain-containing protein [Cellvibrionaceae bacterium]|nr:DUF3488 and transglutaminase-like domain-containing protein [Cellvibrionaceae bacterium]